MTTILIKISYILFIFSLMILLLISKNYEPNSSSINDYFDLDVDDYLTTNVNISKITKISEDFYILEIITQKKIIATSKILPPENRTRIIARVTNYKGENQLEIIRYKKI